MKLVAPLAGIGIGAVTGLIMAFGAQAVLAENSIPDLPTPPAEQSLLGQVEYGSRG